VGRQGLKLTEMLDTRGLLRPNHFPMSWREACVSEQELQRQAKHRLAVIRHAQEGARTYPASPPLRSAPVRFAMLALLVNPQCGVVCYIVDLQDGHIGGAQCPPGRTGPQSNELPPPAEENRSSCSARPVGCSSASHTRDRDSPSNRSRGAHSFQRAPACVSCNRSSERDFLIVWAISTGRASTCSAGHLSSPPATTSSAKRGRF
jgi:hypothetical protein